MPSVLKRGEGFSKASNLSLSGLLPAVLRISHLPIPLPWLSCSLSCSLSLHVIAHFLVPFVFLCRVSLPCHVICQNVCSKARVHDVFIMCS